MIWSFIVEDRFAETTEPPVAVAIDVSEHGERMERTTVDIPLSSFCRIGYRLVQCPATPPARLRARTRNWTSVGRHLDSDYGGLFGRTATKNT